MIGARAVRRVRARWDRWGLDPVTATAALMEAATIVITWRLWLPGDLVAGGPVPTLPASGLLGSGADRLADVPWAPFLLVSALAAVAWPRRAGPVHAVLLLLAMAGDQTRIQPELVSLTVLLTAPAFGPGGRQVARWVLAAMWFWSGLHKALSPGWASGQAAIIAGDLGRATWRPAVAAVVPAAELAVGAAGLWRRSWPVTRWGGAALHTGILLWLSPLVAGRNMAVWPWNVALVVAALGLFGPAEAVWRPRVRATGWVVPVALLAWPALVYRTGEHVYLSHHLYTAAIPSASVCRADGACVDAFSTAGLRVPFPPEPRLFRQRFRLDCAFGDTLTVHHPATRVTEAETEEVPCVRVDPTLVPAF